MSGCAVSNNQEHVNTFLGRYYPSSFLYANIPTRCLEANNTAYSAFSSPLRLATIQNTSSNSLIDATRLTSYTYNGVL